MKIIAITGGSGSGKSTLAAALQAQLSCPVLTEDDYYRDNASTPGFQAETFNFDHLQARDHQLLSDHLQQLKSGERISKPHYCFKTHRRLPQTSPLYPDEFLIIEGIHLLCNAQIRHLVDFSVFIDLPADIRFLLRVQRDIQERGRTLASVINQYLDTVRPAHEQFTEPSKAFADCVITPEVPQSSKIEQRTDELERAVNKVLSDLKQKGWFKQTV